MPKIKKARAARSRVESFGVVERAGKFHVIRNGVIQRVPHDTHADAIADAYCQERLAIRDRRARFSMRKYARFIKAGEFTSEDVS